MNPTRVIVNREGEGISPERAAQRGITSDVIFVRNDGWSLGAPTRFESIARRMYEWSSIWRKGDDGTWRQE